MGDKTPEATDATVQAQEPGHATEPRQLERNQLHYTRTTGRRRWTTDENKDVMICFYKAKSQGSFSGKKMTELWNVKHPDVKLDEKRLTAQKNTILRKKWFTKIEPLLFVISLIPLTTILNNTLKGYKLNNEIMLNHLLYMDDLKLYAKNDKQVFCILYESLAKI